MYTFKRRSLISLIVPISILLSYVVKTTLDTLNQTDPTLSPEANVIVLQFAILLFNLLIGYLLSVMFFSFESITQVIINKHIDFNKVLERCRTRTFSQNIQTLENYDTRNSYKITNSILFQLIIIAIMLYASFTNSALSGKVLVLSIGVQLLVEQFLKISKGDDIQEWFWQVGTTINIDVQRMYFLGASIMTFMAFYFMLYV